MLSKYNVTAILFYVEKKNKITVVDVRLFAVPSSLPPAASHLIITAPPISGKRLS